MEEDETFTVSRAGDEGRGPLHVAVCGRGIALQGALFERRPEVLEIVGQWYALRGDGYEMHVGREVFFFSAEPSGAADHFDRWFRFLTGELLPRAREVLEWRSPDVGAALRARGAVPCPECRRPVLPRTGLVGTTLLG